MYICMMALWDIVVIENSFFLGFYQKNRVILDIIIGGCSVLCVGCILIRILY